MEIKDELHKYLLGTLEQVRMVVSRLEWMEKNGSLDTNELQVCWQSLTGSAFELKNIQYKAGGKQS